MTTEAPPYPRLSFVIPARNESFFIDKCLQSIHRHCAGHNFEIIVIDNNSTDETADLARAAGATIYDQTSGTIGALRNFGVSKASGEIIVFVDADVVITPEWSQNITALLTDIDNNGRLVSGSHCAAPESDPPMLRNWFNSIANETNSRHLGTGHLIISREFFNHLSGFDESLASGEDYNFCQNILANGGEIENRPELVALHLDFPKNANNFIKREKWHGKADMTSLGAILASKVAVAAIVFLALHLLLLLVLLCSLCSNAPGFLNGLLVTAAIAAMIVATNIRKFGPQNPILFLSNFFVGYLYFVGRSLSLRFFFSR